ncbi:MAG: CYTH domain-containing protein [Roseivirga sp.]|nr:CYTH domain-containing protein [Roseivirga sp.]
MAIEIERKFLLSNSSWREEIYGSWQISQGYLSSAPERTVRVRILDQQAFITIKSKTQGTKRAEFEYEIPIRDARELILLCENSIIEKVRYLVKIENKTWEIDEFAGDNQGLIVAEVELETEEETITLPRWVGKEVSDKPRYFNASLIRHPYNQWTKSEKENF